ncbi:EndoU domain-containing protein [Frankia sp. AgKG'84/4]|uniref:EndoU domain-containing protein n=1 Tax=Frankia sp. AgKG'84/4 TaxID=573490 RepID=UPI00200CEF4D|nr:EndoU domain-containing protein [Frankia sp. AgKG'84/4]MCL9795200.1 EndoU domain-containing protein [Frankia sp. AgKG'84/4]
MAELDRPRPTDPSDSPAPPTDAPSPGTRDGLSPRSEPERKAALLDNRAAALDRAPATDKPPTPTNARPTTALDRKLDRLEAAALTRRSTPDAPEPPRRPPAERPDTPRSDADGPHAPEIREKVYEHILHGEWNKRGKPVGFHSAPDGQPPTDRRITAAGTRDANGAYSAEVEFRHPTTGQWARKDVPKHTMFPDSWSADDIRTAVQSAYEKAYDRDIAPALRDGLKPGRIYESHNGLLMQLYVDQDGRLKTAFPTNIEETDN